MSTFNKILFMRKLIFIVVLFAAFGFNTAQNKNKIVNPKHIISAAKSTADSDCAIFLKLAELAADAARSRTLVPDRRSG